MKEACVEEVSLEKARVEEVSLGRIVWRRLV